MQAKQDIAIKNIKVKGNDRTKEFTIKRELLFIEDSIYVFEDFSQFETSIKQSENRVLNLNLFNSVNITYTKGQSEYNLHVTVVEKWYIWPLPFVEFSDRNFNIWSDLSFDPSRTNYGLYLFNYNLFGRNHTLKTSFVYGYNQTYGLEYRVPFLSKTSNLGLATKLKYTSQAEVWLNTENDRLQFYKNGQNNLISKVESAVSLSKRTTPYTHAGIYISALSTKLDSSVQRISNDFLLSEQDKLTVIETGLTYSFDNRDNIYFTTNGVYISPSIALQYYNASSSFTNVLTNLKIQKFSQHGYKLFSSASILAEMNLVDILPYENSKRFGYSNNIRGFERYVVEGKNAILVNTEIKYQVVNKPHIPLKFIPFKNYKFVPLDAYLGCFVDAGYVKSSDVKPLNVLPNKLLYSAGITLQTLVYNDRIIRLEYSLNSLKETGLFLHFTKAI